jgi:hypothetical protein
MRLIGSPSQDGAFINLIVVAVERRQIRSAIHA